MDPLSCIASIIAIVSATKAGVNGLRKLQSLHKAPREVGELLGELREFEILLEKIKEFLQQNHHVQYALLLESLVKQGGDVVGEINNLLTSPSSKLFKWSGANKEQINWVQENKKLKSLRKTLRRIRKDLVSILTAYAKARTSKSSFR